MLGIKKSNTAYNIGEWNNKAMKMQRILDAAFFFVEINIFFGRLAGERIECCKNDSIFLKTCCKNGNIIDLSWCKNDIIDDNLYCKNDKISADMLYWI